MVYSNTKEKIGKFYYRTIFNLHDKKKTTKNKVRKPLPNLKKIHHR